jgi:hypothetical protein
LRRRTIVYTPLWCGSEWDPPKADDFALTREDHAALDEPRLVTLGMSDLANLLVVVYTYQEPDAVRLISAWKANRRQRKAYEKGRS